MLSNNAAGVPRLFARTTTPLRTAAGDVEARWIAGVLTESRYFDTRADDDYRALAGAVVTLRPRGAPRLTLGAERTVVSPIETAGGFAARAFDAVARWRFAEDSSSERARGLPLFGLFAHWLAADAGTEVYGEWTRSRFPRSLREFLAAPHDTRGYTVGFAHALRPSRVARVVTRLEMTDLETSHVLADRPIPADFYTSGTTPHGHTQRGQLLGAALGPGGSSQWLSVAYVRDAWQVELFGRRQRLENDALYRQRLAGPARHDVAVTGGLRGTALLPGVEARAELSLTDRMNYLFQNGSANVGGVRTVDVHNLRLALDVAPRRARRAPAAPPRP